MNMFYLPAIRIRGFRTFRDVLFRFNRLELIVGANGTGKSSLFEFLRFLRDSCHREIPPEIIQNAGGQKIFNSPDAKRFFWNAQINYQKKDAIFYQGELEKTYEGAAVHFERIFTKKPSWQNKEGSFTFLDFRNGKGLVRDPSDGDFLRKEWLMGRSDQLGLGAITDANLKILHELRNYIRSWRFYSGSNIDFQKMRLPALMHHTELLDEDAGNLSAVLYHLMTDHPEAFDDLQSLIRFAIPGFKNLEIRNWKETDKVFAFWTEESGETEMTFADLSDGALKFIALATLCVCPSPPPLICIDDPEQNLHPRILPILSGLFEKASEKTQVLLATHASYFLSQFDPENISVMKKTSGGVIFVNVRNSQALKQIDSDKLEEMHRADELETLV